MLDLWVRLSFIPETSLPHRWLVGGWEPVPFRGEVGCVGIRQQAELITLLKQHAETVATARKREKSHSE